MVYVGCDGTYGEVLETLDSGDRRRIGAMCWYVILVKMDGIIN